MTEANGSFLIQPVKPGTYSIRIHFLGYDVYMGEEFILTEQIKDLGTIPMRMLEVGLQEVEVVANKKQVIYKLDKKIIGRNRCRYPREHAFHPGERRGRGYLPGE